MTDVLIIDDDRTVREFLRMCIENTNGEFRVCGEASNGKAGLELTCSLLPDIILLDIEMPVMSGIEYLKHVPEHLYSRILVLSCHDEYEYVHDAMKYGVPDYIIKQHIDEENLPEMLREIRDANAASAEEAADESSLKNDGIFAIRECIPADAMYAVGAVRMDDMESIRLHHGMRVLDRLETALWKAISKESEGRRVFRISPGHYAALMVAGQRMNSKAETKRWLARCSEEISSSAYSSVTIGIAGPSTDPEQFANLWRDAERAVDGRFQNGAGGIHYACDSSFASENREVFEKTLAELLKSINDYDELLKHSAEIFRIARENRTGPECFFGIAQIMIFLPVQLYALHAHDASKIYETIDILDESKAALETLDSFEKWYYDALRAARAGLRQEMNLRPEIGDAMAYIAKHYAEDLTLDSVARHVGLSKTYFSSIFKQETGSNFSRYLQDYRLTRVCEALLSGNRLIYAISVENGFKSPNHLNNAFREKYGITPKRFRDMAREEQNRN